MARCLVWLVLVELAAGNTKCCQRFETKTRNIPCSSYFGVSSPLTRYQEAPCFPYPDTNAASSLKRIRGISRIDPILGLVTPSQDIRDLLASIPRNSKEKNTNVQRSGSESREEEVDRDKDTGEDMRPSEESEDQHANMGFELYWPGGEWVQRKAAVDHCNTSAEECPLMYKRYGKVCASSIGYEAQHTFRDMCELEDTNCRDGSASFFTASEYPRNLQWFPVKRDSSLVIKFSAPGWLEMIFAREKDIDVQPQLIFFLDSRKDHYYEFYVQYSVWDGYNTYITYEYFAPKDKTLPGTQVRTFQAKWFDNEGYVRWTDLDTGTSHDLPPEGWERKERRFPVRYFGVWGGSQTQPHWIQLKGLPRGYLAAYRGPCREDLPTLKPNVAGQMGDRHKIQLFNFAGRMDVRDYNFSRINGSLPNEHGGDYFQDYHALP